MTIGQIAGLAGHLGVSLREDEESLLLLSGALLQHVSKADGSASLRSPHDGRAWVRREEFVLESETGASLSAEASAEADWMPVGAHLAARLAPNVPPEQARGAGEGAEAGELVREVGGAQARATIGSRATDGGGLKLRFVVEAARAGRYRLRWRLGGLRGERVPGALAHGVRIVDHGDSLDIDWSDLESSTGVSPVSGEAGPGVSPVALESTADGLAIVFGPFDLEGGQRVELDPTIGAVCHYDALSWSLGRHLARTSDGVLHLVYWDIDTSNASSRQVFYRYSTDGGSTWSSPTQLSPQTGTGHSVWCTYCAIASDGKDDLHVVYSGEDTGSYATVYQVWYLRRHNGSWDTTPQRISTGGGMGGYFQWLPAISVDASDGLHVVWYGCASGFTAKNQVWWTSFGSGFVNQQGPTRISAGTDKAGYDQEYPSIVADNQGGLHAVWWGESSDYQTAQQIWYAACTQGAWQTPVRISTAAGMSSYAQDIPSLAVDVSGDVHVAWDGSATGYTGATQIWYARRAQGAWQTPARISTGSGMAALTQAYPALAIGGNGTLHVFWSGSDGTYSNQVFYTALTGGSWGAPAAQTTSGANGYPQVRWAPFCNWQGGLEWVWVLTAGSTYTIEFASNPAVVPVGVEVPVYTVYDPLNRVSAVQDAQGGVTGYQYDALGRPTVQLSPLGHATTRSYDPAGQLSTVQDATGAVTSYQYDPAGRQTVAIDATGSATTSTWDAAGRRTGVLDAQGNRTTYTYDGLGRVLTSQDPAQQVTTFVYLRRFLQAQTDPTGAFATYAYDGVGNRLSVQDPKGSLTSFGYDPVNRLTSQQDPVGDVTTYQYDAVGNRIRQIDALFQTTSYDFDGGNRPYRMTDPTGAVWTTGYDGRGLRLAQVDANGHTVSYAYDGNSRLTAITDALGNVATNQYDADGRRLSVTNARGFIATYQYDAVGRVVLQQDAVGEQTVYQYDAAGNQTAAIQAG